MSPAVPPPFADERFRVVFNPPRIRAGDVVWVEARGVRAGAVIEGVLAGRPLSFFPHEGGYVAVGGIDLDVRPGPARWWLEIREPRRDSRTVRGTIDVQLRAFVVQRLTLPPAMVDLDPATEHRATAEAARLRALYLTITPERLWRGRFIRPVGGSEPGSGFGSRRIINGQPRMAHSGTDFPAPLGAQVVAANAGRVALVAEHFFPGRLVAIDHGLGLYTLYFHLDTMAVVEGERVDRGQTIGTVGTTGRATGPHLHFGAQVGPARVDPEALLSMGFRD